MKNSGLGNLDGLLVGSAAREIRRMEQQRASWMRTTIHSHSLAEQMKKLVGETSFVADMVKQAEDLQASPLAEQMKRLMSESSLAGQVAKQWQESRKAEQESIRKMLDPIKDIHKGFLADSVITRMLGGIPAPEQTAKLMQSAVGSKAFLEAMHSTIEGSTASARKFLTDASVGIGIGQLVKSFEEANKRWLVPQQLLDALSPLQALQEQIGRLSLPVMDAASAATLSKVLGPEGIQAQLAALGIGLDGTLSAQLGQQEEGIGLSRKSLELMALLSFILAVLLPLYQEISSSRWQAATDKTLAAQMRMMEAQSSALERQRKMIEALSKLVEKALVQEAKRQEERFVVLDRVAVIRSQPEHGSSVEGKLLPREVVRPMSERGKWIEVEYYHWLRKEHRTGWALKKYFQRVPANFEKTDQEAKGR